MTDSFGAAGDSGRDPTGSRPPDATFADILNGFTGFTLHRGRSRAERAGGTDEPDRPETVEPADEPGSGSADGVEPPVYRTPLLRSPFVGRPFLPADDLGDEAAMVRPYAWTRGRTRSKVDLKLETLVSTSERGHDDAALGQVEYRSVGSLCRHPHSVAEVAAKLSIPLGVARVILSDMAELGLISIHRTFADDDIAAHLVLMERVLSGLRRL
jgi:hypothetical protein